MEKCNSYKIPCIYALSEPSPLPCFGSQEQCIAWRAKYKTEVTDALPQEEISKLEVKLLVN
ncbi:MAG: hypothetical protein V1886_02290 [archaeon]